jgi:hypothetical protein
MSEEGEVENCGAKVSQELDKEKEWFDVRMKLISSF